MTTSRRTDDLPPAIVAAIMAALSAVRADPSTGSGQAQPQDEPPVHNWANATRVAPRWREAGPNGWRDVERARGWRRA